MPPGNEGRLDSAAVWRAQSLVAGSSEKSPKCSQMVTWTSLFPHLFSRKIKITITASNKNVYEIYR